MTFFLMLLLLVIYSLIITYKLQFVADQKSAFDANDAKMLKGIFCIVVILVHVPSSYQNTVQSILGSFAYIGVTYFFMASGYGLSYGVKSKPDYLKSFWSKRFVKVLIPAVVCNIISCLLRMTTGQKLRVLDYLNIHGWVKTLLLMYIIFWIFHAIDRRIKLLIDVDYMISAVIIVLSLVTYFTDYKVFILWTVESLGFIYGIVLSKYKTTVHKDKVIKNSTFVIITSIALVLGIAYVKYKSVYFIGDYCLKVVLGFVCIILLVLLTKRIRIGNSILSALAKVSYEFFLMQFVVFSITNSIFAGVNSGIYIWICIIATLFLSFLAHCISNCIYCKYLMIKGE